MTKTKITVLSGLLIAFEIILTRFVQVPVTLFGTFTDKIHLGFLPVALAGILFGPLTGGLVGGVADFLRAIIFPQGAFNPLFTVGAVIRGVVYGLILHKKPAPLRIIIASVINFTLVNIFYISLIMKFSYAPDSPLSVIIWNKLPVSAVNFVIQVAVLLIAAKPIERNLKNV